MPRRRRTGRRINVADLSMPQRFELMWGPYGDFRQLCPRCRGLERQQSPFFTALSAFRKNLDATRWTDLQGFHADDASPCLSRYESPEERESAYWAWRDLREEHMTAVRPWAWWFYESAGVCRHRPRCERPPLRLTGDQHEQTAWLEHHDVLSVRELATLARREGD